MAVFSKLVTTENGRTLIARMLSGGEKITFTRVCSSDREYDLEELINLEVLEDIRQTGSVSKVSRTNDISVKVETVFTNTELTEGYYMRTVALYARGGEGEEVLYAAAVETSGNCFMPAFGGITVSGAYIQLVTTVSNTENVTLEVDNSVFATIGNIMELQEQIDGIGELVGNVVSVVNMQTEKIKMLDQIGKWVYSNPNLNLGGNIPNEKNTEVLRIPLTSVSEFFEEGMYYLYEIKNQNGKLCRVHYENDYEKELEGFLWITFLIGHFNIQKAVPISPGYFGNTREYMATIDGMAVNSRPVMNDILIKIEPFIAERVDGKLKKLEGGINISISLELWVYKLGKVLSGIHGEDSVPSVPSGGSSGGTSNYNLLNNKPSINNITLQGNLTSKQLGLEGSTGSITEMTYEEAMAILNETEEDTEK